MLVTLRTADNKQAVHVNAVHVAFVLGEDDAPSVQVVLSSGVGLQVENFAPMPVRRQIDEALKVWTGHRP